MLSMGKSILTFFFFSFGEPDLRMDRARASPNFPISTGSNTGTFATWRMQVTTIGIIESNRDGIEQDPIVKNTTHSMRCQCI